MKTIMTILLVANIFIVGCNVQEKKAALKEGEMTTEVRQAADELNKQIDVLSANLKGTTAVISKEMPGITLKVKELLAELQVLGNEVQQAIP